MLSKLILGAKPADPLNPHTVPGTRKVNNLPLVLAGGALLIFAVIIGMVMMHRSESDSAGEKETPKTSTGATQFASELTAPWTSGLVPSASDVPAPAPALNLPDPGKTDKTPNSSSQVQTPDLVFASRHTRISDPWNEARERFRSSRLQSFESAVKSRTGVQVSAQRSSVPRSSEEVQERIQATRQQIASAGNDPMAAYRARLAALSGSAGSGRGTGVELPRELTSAGSGVPFSRNNWTLAESVASPEPFTLQAGFVLPAIMISGINSNLPGQVMAQISQDVYDTPTGRYLLIPQGTRLIGVYNSDVAYGQERVLMAWQRLLFPDGRTLNIQAMPGADNAGYAGFEDQVNNHYIRTFSSAFLLSGVIAAVAMSQDTNSDTGDRQRASDSLSEALGQTLGSTMAEMIRKNLNIAPTLQIRPGYRFNVMVTKDIVFDGPYAFSNNQRQRGGR